MPIWMHLGIDVITIWMYFGYWCAASMDEFWVLMCCQYECSLGIDANMDAVKVLMCCQYRYILDIDVLPYGCILNIDVLPVWMQFGYRYPQTRRYWCQCGCLSAVRRGISHKYDRDPSLWVLIWCQYGCCSCWEGCPTNVMYSDLWGRWSPSLLESSTWLKLLSWSSLQIILEIIYLFTSYSRLL